MERDEKDDRLVMVQKLFKNQLRPKKYRVKLSDIIKVSQPRSTYQPQPETEETFTLPPRSIKTSPPAESGSEDELESIDITVNHTHQPETDITEESLKIATDILKDILVNNEKLGITVPIGLNVEHIMSYNFQYSINMLQELSKIYREFCIKTSLYD